ncbi:hypothetical protein MMC12_007469 [Toensbergia leucococca]|nr:hypothetical protein [Toensbergia leucococca]
MYLTATNLSFFVCPYPISRKFQTYLNGQHHLVEQKLHQKYGNVIRTGPNSLAFSSLSAFNAIYGFNKSIEKGDFYDFGRDSTTRAGSIFSARTDAIHSEHKRKLVGPALLNNKISSYQPVISKNVSILVSRLVEAQASLGHRSTVNVAPYIHRFTFDTLVEIIYGEPVCSQPYTETQGGLTILTGFRELSKMAWGAALLPWFGWLMSTRPMVYLSRRPTYDSKGNLTSIAALAASTRDVVFAHPEKALESSQPSILKNYLEVPKSDSKHMLPDEIWRECFNLIFAGPGSTAAALTATLYQLGTKDGRKWQDRIQADPLANASTPTSSTVLIAVIKETLRLHAPFSTAFPRSITPRAETAIRELPAPLPIGTVVSANLYILGRSKEIWGDDAESWKPQRWLGSESETKKLDDGFVAFSKGPRGCVGKEIAMMMLAKATVTVLQKWEINSKGILKGQNFIEMQYVECGLELTEKRKR